MFSGEGPFGGLDMGGMFTTVKVREGLARGDYKDPGWYKHPKHSVAYEWTGAPIAETRAPDSGRTSSRRGEAILRVTKGGSHHEH
jgi:hypothetical protein